MKVLSIEMSQMTALFHATRHEGQVYLPKLVEGLVKRYRFVGVPQNYAEMVADRVDFKHGLFQGSAIESLQVFSDGIVIKSRSDSDRVDTFVTDLIQWATNEIGLSIFSNRTINRMYDSQLIVEADQRILQPFSVLTNLGSEIREMVLKNTGLDAEYHWAGFILAPDQIKLSSLKPSIFRVERWFDSEFQLNQFYSSAPLKTKQHISLLENLENNFVSKF